jgi:hypothetical protein
MGWVPLDSPGALTETVDELGQVVSLPVGTSEYWYVKVAVEVAEIVTVLGAALAWVDTSTLKPSMMVTGSVVPAGYSRAMVG